MFGIIFRIFWRLLVFALAVGLAYATAFLAFPYLDKRIPILPVLLILYLVVAYVGIPALMRFWRVVFKPNHIPVYATTSDGWPADPVNIAVIARSERHLTKAMKLAGWHKADKASLWNNLREAYAILFNKPYKNAPFSKLYMSGRPFDVGYQKQRTPNSSPRVRHHVRFWRLDEELHKDSHAHHFTFWRKHFMHLLGTDRHVWIGAAIDDTGPVGLRWRSFQITHSNNPDTNIERDLIVSDLQASKTVKRQTVLHADEPFTFYGQTLGNYFVCDGQIKVVELRHPTVTAFKFAGKK